MKYEKFTYLYPPRPEHKMPAKNLDKYDNGEYLAQPKYNGSACVVFTDGNELHVYDRHKTILSYVNYNAVDFKLLAVVPGKWYAYAGEYLNKGKNGETNQKEQHKFVIWDILVYEGNYLVGTTVESRMELLELHFPTQRAMVTPESLKMYEHLSITTLKGIFKAPTYNNGFTQLYYDIVKTDLYEGLVLKKKTGKLDYGYQSANNRGWQIKCRKETKIYKF